MNRGLVLLLAFGTADACACSCAHGSLEERLDGVSVVALVRIESVQLNPEWAASLQLEDLDVEPLSASFVVLETLKGELRDSDRLATGYGSGDCGLPLIPGQDLLLATYGDGPEWTVGLCSPSRVLGVRSLLEDMHGRRLDGATEAYVDAVRRYLINREPSHRCASFEHLPWRDSPQDQALKVECAEHFESFERNSEE